METPPVLVEFICPTCNKLLLHTIPSAKVYCSKCHSWAIINTINLPPVITCKERRVANDSN